VFVYNHLWVNLLLLGIFSVPIFRFLYTNKRALFFVSYTYFLLLAFTTAVYGGFFWHSYFFYIYLIVGLWISFFGENSDNIRIWAIIALSIIAGILIFHRPTVSERFFVYGPLKTKYFIKILENDEKLKSAQILQNDGLIRESIPYASNKDFDLKVHCCIPNISEHSLLTGDNKLCTVKRTIEQAKREPACIYSKVMGTNKDSYTYIDSVDYVTERTFYNIPANGYSIYFNKYKCYGRYCFWKIEVKDGKTN
jgi:hypothetical protein